MITLGIYNLGVDPSAAIIQNGNAIAYVEEERLIRYKHASNLFPINAIAQVFKQTKLDWDQIDNIAIPWQCAKYDDGTMEKHYDSINTRYDINHKNDIAYEKAKLAEYKSENQKSIILKQLRRVYGNIQFPEILFVNHHLAHACTTFFTSGISESIVLTLDGSGEEVTISIWEGKNNRLELLKEVKTPVSLGWFYSAITEYLGFTAYGDEWQVMGLSAYGKKSAIYKKAKMRLDAVIWYDQTGGVDCNPHYISLGNKTFSNFCSDSFATLMGRSPRASDAEITQWHKDIALAAQNHLEEIILEVSKYWAIKTGNHNLCLAGGVAMNVKMNGALFESDWIQKMYVYPIASDSGTSIGAGMALYYNLEGNLQNQPLGHVYLGNKYSDREIEVILMRCQLKFFKPENLEGYVAQQIADNKVIGWFQLGMEGGQRALGARSILANPLNIESKNTVNRIIKQRQIWRPFCPSMLQDDVSKYFVLGEKIKKNLKNGAFSFMTMTLTANDLAKREIPAVIHEDGTSRIQIVSEHPNERYYKLLTELKELTGTGTVLNTSFNVKGDPIVCSPVDAIRTFYATGIDLLVIGNCILLK
ncbi:carbamoyltransferase [Pedobacter sp. WC2423]|uniref:carbamoyltransferase family protein n=1 Tax=Pedobacter sp. WC2423 TaxID=3234142 RepID=UPI0034679FDE